LRVPFDDDTEGAGLAVLTGDVGVVAFACYTTLATAVVMAGHSRLGRLVRTEDLRVQRPWALVMLLSGIALMALLVLPTVWWAPLELAVLLGGCLLVLRRWQHLRSATSAQPALTTLTEPIPGSRLAYLAALPVAAVTTYTTGVTLDLSDDALRTLRTGIVLSQTVLGWALLLLAFLVAHRRAAQPA
jgi:hypothetical protein